MSKYRWYCVISVTVVILAGLLLRAAPDPASLQVQGPPSIGNPFPTRVLPPGVTGVTPTQLLGTQTGGNQINTATLTGAAGQFTCLCGFTATAAGSTAGLNVTITTTGLATNLNWTFSFPAGALTGARPVAVTFWPPLVSSAVNTDITVVLPAGGAGNTNASVSAWGFRQ